MLWAFALRGGSLDVADGVMNSAIGAGRLELIVDTELRQLIARWPSEVSNFRDVDAGYADFRSSQLIAFLADKIDPPPMTGAEAFGLGHLADGDYSAVLGTVDFDRRLRWAARIHDIHEVTAAALYDLLDRTEARLREELRR